MEEHAEDNPERNREELQQWSLDGKSHRPGPFLWSSLRKRSEAVAIPAMNITAKNIQLLNANCRAPLMPCPLVHPPAMRAPYITMMPPTNAATKRAVVE